MKDIKLLDCTLRDGGYVNDWEFGHDNIINIFERLVSANVEIIEVGFLNDSREFDINRTIMPNTASVDKIFSGLDKGTSVVVGMIDYGTCAIENLAPQSEGFLDGIRVIFKKQVMVPALAYCAEVKKLGYKVFAQAVSITSYSDDEMLQLLTMVNELEPFAFSLVDTYGLLHKNKLIHYYSMAHEHLKSTVGLGYHSHNNFQLAYANCLELISDAPEDRILVIDGTLHGMGKGAGNAPIELLAMYMNDNSSKHYHIGQMLEAIDLTILEAYKKSTWGYSLKFFIAASNDCHPNYVTYLMDKKTLSIKSINEILEVITEEKKLMYDKAYIEHLYLDYQKKEDINDFEDLKKLKTIFQGKHVLLLGSGNSVVSERAKIQSYINEFAPIIIAVNYLPDYPVDFIFISNSRRYVQLSSRINKLDEKTKLIATSNVTKTNGKFDYTLEYSALLDEKAEFADNPMIMLIKVLDTCETADVILAGFDGYSTGNTSDYVNPEMEYSFSKTKAMEINNDAIASLNRLTTKVPKLFLTKSCYTSADNC